LNTFNKYVIVGTRDLNGKFNVCCRWYGTC